MNGAKYVLDEEILMNPLLDVIEVKAIEGYQLVLRFENGETKVFEMTPLMDKKPFVKIRNKNLFKCATINCGTFVWPNNIDIAPETLYLLGKSIASEEYNNYAIL